MTDPITTGDAAKLLGCSRQHVVNLCNQGKLPVERMGSGSHRYVSHADVLALLAPPATRDQQQSLWLHTAVAGHLVQDPDAVIERARGNLDRFSSAHSGTMAEHWFNVWRGILDSGPAQIRNMLTADTPQARELRQNSPFTGILSQEERTTVLKSFRQKWAGSAAAS